MSRILEFAREELGLDLSAVQSEMLASFEASGASQAVWQCGRRGGKSLLADVLALFDAGVRDQLREHLRPGEPRVTAVVAQRLDAAHDHIASIAAMVERSPRLRRLLVGAPTTDEIAFTNGSRIRAYPCSARAIRGGAWSCAVLDELAHYVDTQEGNAAGDRVLEAAHPSLAQFGHAGWLVAISTPRWRQGAFWRLVERGSSGKFPRVHYRHRSTAAMNPRISAEWLAEREVEDPELFRREYLAEFDSAGAYLSADDVLAAVERGRRISPPAAGINYKMSLDPADFRDAFTAAIAHREAKEDGGRILVDGMWAWTRAGHDLTLDAVRDIAHEYRVGEVTTDQHAAAAIVEGLARRGVRARYQPWTSQSKGDAFASLKVALNTRQIVLPDDDALVRELLNLEARPTPGGFARIAAVGGGHDDRAVALAAVVHQLSARRQVPLIAPMSVGYRESLWK
ncbi:MAG: hypothetical protein M3067_05940 [Chloroflexota bacterium]|nr:hypothetical protein [Chloroflexota bacterium]